MVLFLNICAALELLIGLAVLSAAKGAIHEIPGALAMGFGVMTIALAAILKEVRYAVKFPGPRLSPSRNESAGG
jgi:hypothetical protein